MIIELFSTVLKVSTVISTLGAILLLNYNNRYFLAFIDNQTYWVYHFCVVVASLVPLTAVFGLPQADSLMGLLILLFIVPTVALLIRQEQQ